MTDGVFPREVDVLSHGFDFRPWWWQKRVPEAWSAFLSELPGAERGNGYHHITRADLFAMARDQSSQACGTLLVACYAWGVGPAAFLVPRMARVFRDTAPLVLNDRLTDARRLLTEEGPAAAYASLADGGPNRTKFMGASFFTKFLYAADWHTARRTPRALILDRLVALALNDLHDWGLRERGPWSADTYGRWVEHADAEAHETSSVDQHVRPDAIEMAYFQHGRDLERARRARG